MKLKLITNNQNPKKKLKAFTLVELVLVFGLISIISVSSFQVLRNYYTTSLVDTEARTLYSYLRLARQQAMSNDSSSNYSVKFLSTSYVGFLGETYVPGAAGNDVQEIINDVTITSNFSDDILTFTNYNGRAVAAGTVTITGSTGIGITIDINELGIIEY